MAELLFDHPSMFKEQPISFTSPDFSSQDSSSMSFSGSQVNSQDKV